MKKENMIFRLKMEIASLVNEMVSKLPETLFLSDSTTFLDPSMASGQYVAAIEQRLRTHGHSDENIKSRVFGVEKNMLRVNYAIKKNKLVGTYSVDVNDIPSILIGYMKFDCIVGNPPYQRKVGPNNTEPLWHIFVDKSITALTEGGYLCYVHPSGWRDVTGRYDKTKNLIISKDIQYLEIHNKLDGIKTFGATTSYDWYILKNSPSVKKTTVKFQDGSTKIIDLNALSFIPNGSYDKIVSLLAKNGEDVVKIIHSYSEYETRKPHIRKEKIGNFIYPCAYIVKTDNSLELVYSNVKKAHFGTPKLIWGNGGCGMGSFLDRDGKYGLTQFCYAIVDDSKNLNDIKKSFDSEEFRNLMKCCADNSGNINRKVLALFRKDFYKDFI